jgi:penicillin-binding protein 1A
MAKRKLFKRLWKKIRPSKKTQRRLKRLFLIGAATATMLFAWLIYDLPAIDSLDKFTRAPSVLIKAEDGSIIGSSGNIYGDYVSYKELPKSLVDAIIATEDRRFYNHFGIDIIGIVRAGFVNMQAGRIVQGASTITQQVAKNLFLTPERKWSRKAREILLALKLEWRYSKQEILSIYLNRIYLGAGNYGVDAASKRYFGKSARDLELTESAILAGMPQAPSRFAPTTNPKLARQRAEQVLAKMQDAGFLNQKQYDKAIQDLEGTIGTRQRDSQSSFYFSDWIMDQLPEFIGNIEEDIVVTTTFQPALQALGEKAMMGIMNEKAEALNVKQAALLAMTPDGAVRAMIGGRSYAGSQYNRATQALRQPGSSFKLFVYLAGLESGMTPDMTLEDQPITLPIVGGKWSPKNYTNKYLGTITLREAVAQSVNTIAVQVSQMAGLERVIDVTRRLGVTSEMLAVPSLALGATEVNLLEMTNAYAHLASGGVIVYPYGITRIETVSGKPVYTRQSNISGVVLRPDVVGHMNELLQAVVTEGTGRAATIGRPVAGKTGTTSDYKDAWFIGYTPQLVAGVWVGNDDNTPMKKVTGGMLPAQIWHDFMQPALAAEPIAEIPTGGLPSPMPWQKDLTQETSPPKPFRLPWQTDDEAPTAEPQPVEQSDLPPPERKNALPAEFWDKLDKVPRE